MALKATEGDKVPVGSGLRPCAPGCCPAGPAGKRVRRPEGLPHI